jgi:hypothetical protein
MSANVGPKLKQQISPEAMIVSGGSNVDKNYPIRPDTTKGSATSFEQHLRKADKEVAKAVAQPKPNSVSSRELRSDSNVAARPVKSEKTETSPVKGGQRQPVERREVSTSPREKSTASRPEADSTQLPTVRSSAAIQDNLEGTDGATELNPEASPRPNNEVKNTKAIPASSTEVSEVELQQLKKIFLKNGAPTAKAPVLALLNGNIELLEPGQIPELVTSNPFLSEAFSQLELGNFINQSTELGEIIRDIDPSRDVLEEIQRTGIDLTQLTTPRQFFDAIGLDTNRISTELKHLKSSLQMSDGLASYMLRAAKIRTQLGINPTGETDPVVRRADQQVFDSANGTTSISAAAPKVPTSREKLLPAGEPSFPVTKPQVSAQKVDTYVGMQAIPEQSQKMNLSNDMATMIATEPVIQAEPGLSLQNSSWPSAPTEPGGLKITEQLTANAPLFVPDHKAPSAPLDLRTVDQRPLPTTDLPRTSMAASDPFDSLKLTQPKTFTSQDFGSIAETDLSELNPQEADVSEGIEVSFSEAVLPAENAPTELQLATTPNPGSEKLGNFARPFIADINYTSKVQENKDSKPIEMTSSNEADSSVQFGQAFEVIQQNVKPTVDRGAERPIEISQLIEQISRDAIISDRSAGRDGGSRQGGRDSEASQRDIQLPQRVDQFGTSAVFDLKQEFEIADKAQISTDQIAKKVIEKAEIMLREGGGSVKLEIETKDFGKVDVAIKVDGERLELKLLTTTEGARELVSQNLSKLKEQLSLQNFQLDRVDVGLSMNMNQRGDGSQFMSSEQRHNQQSFMNSGASVDSAKVIPLPLRVRYQPNPYHNGKIQIAV